MATRKNIPDDCMPKCATCRFAEFDRKDDLGYCHRLPPRMFGSADEIGFTFAVVNVDDWCGEYVRQVS